MEPASPESPRHEPKITNLTKRYLESYSGELREITVPSVNIGIDKWQEMLEQTENDGKERGLIVYLDRTGNFEKSEILEGNPSGLATSIGITDAIKRRRRVVYVHTHATRGFEHLATTVPSDQDIHTFAYSNSSAFVILDAKGVHLLTHIKPLGKPTPPPEDLVNGICDKENLGEGLSVHVQRDLARELPKYGISYFYREGVPPAESKTVTFKKLPK